MSAKKTAKPGDDPFLARERAKYQNPVPSREFILDVLEESGRPLTREALAAALEVDGEEAVEGLRRRLIAMERDGQLIRNRRRAYVIVDNEDLVRGRIVGSPDGSGHLAPDLGAERIYLPPRQMRSLLHGDRAVVRVVGLDEQQRPAGELVEVLKRANKQIVGRLYVESGIGFVVPENKRIHHDVIVPHADESEASEGDLVVAEIMQQPSNRRQPIGRVVEVLGAHIEAGMEIDVAARVHGIPVEWPGEVERAVEGLSEQVSEQAKRGRVDLREVPLVTIDGPDARDFDDALYCEPAGKGWRLMVAIADVSHYVQPGNALDGEARERGTSVYFPRAVVPMLPEVLSNGLCSLNPDVDRLCMCCEMLISEKGELTRSRFFRGVMRSHARMTYNEMAAIAVERDEEARAAREPLLAHLDNLMGLYQVLRKARAKRGAINFETSEAELIFDETGRIARIETARRNDAHKLVEECMISANVAAARHLNRHRIPALYRDHETPDEERLAKLRQFLAETGLSLGGGDEPTSKDYSRLMEQVQERPDRHLIQTVLLRSMKAAEYRPDNVGHFGLALDEYAHFTSPIRRYPDLLVHRAIGHILDGGSAESYPISYDAMVGLGEHCSMTERRADEAARDAMMTLKCEYMASYVGEVFDGVISGVTSFGLFVELTDVFVDGLVHVTNLPNDYFHFDPIGHRLIGDRTGVEYKLTDQVQVQVVRVNKDDRQIDFELISHQGEQRQTKRDHKGGDKPARRGGRGPRRGRGPQRR